MATVSSLSGSIVAANNQNIAGLVNVNLDISLFRCEPLEEFRPIASTLSHRRKEEAEGGSQHKLACRLGFLFNDIIPETPKLIRAYGRRVSDTLCRPDVNPSGSGNDGPFRDFVGADGTSIWAAATSMPASISLHLLACLLARSWDAKHATAIWVELISERKRQIQDRLDQSQILNPHTHLALQQEFSRDHIAKWDASVRSWLRRADESMAFKKTQLSLIMDNVRLPPFMDRGTTYEKVTNAWFRSMHVVEALLRNEQQVAYDYVTLLALSAWHLYPDLLVFQDETRKVPFNDHLFSGSAVMSLGIEYHNTNEDKDSTNMTRWSLALSHLKYYGGPVTVSSRDTNRATVDELWLVCLGVVLGQWKVSISTLHVSVQWFGKLGRVILSSTMHGNPAYSWLLSLCRVASLAIQPSSSQRQNGMAFVKFGHRRALRESTHLLGQDGPLAPPFFGLCNPHVMKALPQRNDREIGIEYLRRVVGALGLSTDDAFIVRSTTEPQGIWSEWATIAPVSMKLLNPGYVHQDQKVNARWIFPDDHKDNVNLLSVLEGERSERLEAAEYCELVYKTHSRPNKQWVNQPDAAVLVDAIHDRGYCYLWSPNAPAFFARMCAGARFIPLQTILHTEGVGFSLLVRDTHQHMLEQLQAKMHQEAMQVHLHDGFEWLKHEKNIAQTLPFLEHLLEDQLFTFKRETRSGIGKRKRGGDGWLQNSPDGNTASEHSDQNSYGCYYTVFSYRHLPLQWLKSMRALEIISVLYEQLPNATIPVRITELDLSQAKWLPESLRLSPSFQVLVTISTQEHCQKMTRASSFACIAMLESGQANIEVEHTECVVALCSENSIFVAGILLSDPTTKDLGMSIRHLIGNVGHSGIVLMVAPVEPSIRTPGYDVSLVDHQMYDGKRLDTFKGTSLHLSFTNWKMPVFWESNGDIDQQVFLLESVISVQDKGKWVADLDVLCLEQDGIDVVEFPCDCKVNGPPAEEDIASLDSWDELLDEPTSVGVVRASGNWVARLSIASALVQKGHGHCAVLVGDWPRGICWKHMAELYAYPEPHLPKFIIN